MIDATHTTVARMRAALHGVNPLGDNPLSRLASVAWNDHATPETVTRAAVDWLDQTYGPMAKSARAALVIHALDGHPDAASHRRRWEQAAGLPVSDWYAHYRAGGAA